MDLMTQTQFVFEIRSPEVVTSSGVSGKRCVGDFNGGEPKIMAVHVKGAKLKVLTQ